MELLSTTLTWWSPLAITNTHSCPLLSPPRSPLLVLLKHTAQRRREVPPSPTPTPPHGTNCLNCLNRLWEHCIQGPNQDTCWGGYHICRGTSSNTWWGVSQLSEWGLTLTPSSYFSTLNKIENTYHYKYKSPSHGGSHPHSNCFFCL